MYNGRTDLVEHVSHFSLRMAVNSKNETLMCKVFPSNLGPVAMRWFDGLKEDFDDVAIRTLRVGLPAEHGLRKSLTGKPVKRRTGSRAFKVMSIARPLAEDSSFELKRSRMKVRPALSFSDEDKVGTLQQHDDALVVTFRIEGYDVKRVLVDKGSGAEIMYPDLYKGLKLEPEDLTCYDSPLVGFDGKVVIQRAILDFQYKQVQKWWRWTSL
ncbi:uncharacterized protein LOC142630065 [Castanea sativa]|uniref:uncharacterized protein LOC142630065 n=1 Tax=Castanea sativa TaxID=21020 RepID=UPI003F64CD81